MIVDLSGQSKEQMAYLLFQVADAIAENYAESPQTAVEEMVLSHLLEAITLQEFDDYQDQTVIDNFATLEAMTANERLNWLKACVNRMEEIS